jgi:hypothetical protein
MSPVGVPSQEESRTVFVYSEGLISLSIVLRHRATPLILREGITVRAAQLLGLLRAGPRWRWEDRDRICEALA